MRTKFSPTRQKRGSSLSSYFEHIVGCFSWRDSHFFFLLFYFFNLLTLRTVTKKLANAPLSKVSNLMIWQWELMENRYVGDLPSELSGSERSESDGTFRIDANRPGSDGTKPSSSASEANSCFMYFAIIIITPPPLRLPHPPRIPDVPLASR